jgi:hypothetical protein
MGLVITIAAGLCLWIVLWALNISGFDGMLIAVVMVLVAVAIQNVVPRLIGGRDDSDE